MQCLVLLWSILVVSESLPEDHGALFDDFKQRHGRSYSNLEETHRFAIFKDNLRAIEEHNALYQKGVVTYQVAVNQFSDMTPEEFEVRLGLHSRPSLNKTIKFVRRGLDVPDSVDWRSQGQVTEVKDQGNCGSCWAFAITGTTEAAYYRLTEKLLALSEQQLMDCSTDINSGCDGGHLEQTFPYVLEYGLQSEKSYPYEAQNGECRYQSGKVVAQIKDYALFYDEEILLEIVATVGPVAAAIDAAYISSYSSGVYSTNLCSASSLNHGVLVVGYGSDNGRDYWIVKNSWGTDWGEDGYLRLLRGTNMCGIAEDNTFPILE